MGRTTRHCPVHVTSVNRNIKLVRWGDFAKHRVIFFYINAKTEKNKKIKEAGQCLSNMIENFYPGMFVSCSI